MHFVKNKHLDEYFLLSATAILFDLYDQDTRIRKRDLNLKNNIISLKELALDEIGAIINAVKDAQLPVIHLRQLVFHSPLTSQRFDVAHKFESLQILRCQIIIFQKRSN